MRFLVQVDLSKIEKVKADLKTLGVAPITTVFDYLTVDIPADLVPKIKAIDGVIEVREEKAKRIMYRPMPVEAKFTQFLKLLQNPLTLPQALFFSITEEKERWPTSDSRTMIEADLAEEIGITGKDIKVGVLDTGLDIPCLQLLNSAMGKSSVEGEPFWFDENGHGTHVATTIAGSPLSTPFGNIKGIAPDAQVHVYKVLGYGIGAGTESSVLRGMMDAFQDGCDIISMSLGSSYSPEPASQLPECRAIEMLTKQGIICILANGNDGPDPNTVGVPANSPYALSVGAIDRNGEIASFSSRGPTTEEEIKPDVVAPGVSILSSSTGLISLMEFMDGPKLAAISGTSMATPHCSGLVALALQYAREKDKNLTTEAIKDAMTKYSEREKDNTYGWGLIKFSSLQKYVDEMA